MVPSHLIDRSTLKYRDLFFGRKLDQFGRSRWVMRPPPPDAPKSEISPSPDFFKQRRCKMVVTPA